MANQADQIHQAVSATIRTEIAELRSFVDRRIAELSMEVHATVDLMDFSENNLSGQLKGIREQIASVVGTPMIATRNSGLELEAVVQATEAAANRIMEAAEAIGDWLREGKNDPAGMQAVTEKVNAIFEACSFQDVTGQRIRRAIQHLQQVETMLTTIVPGGAAPANFTQASPTQARPTQASPSKASPSQASPPQAADCNPDLLQDAVDSLFG